MVALAIFVTVIENTKMVKFGKTQNSATKKRPKYFRNHPMLRPSNEKYSVEKKVLVKMIEALTKSVSQNM
jgi:hypothetical protein